MDAHLTRSEPPCRIRGEGTDQGLRLPGAGDLGGVEESRALRSDHLRPRPARSKVLEAHLARRPWADWADDLADPAGPCQARSRRLRSPCPSYSGGQGERSRPPGPGRHGRRVNTARPASSHRIESHEPWIAGSQVHYGITMTTISSDLVRHGDSTPHKATSRRSGCRADVAHEMK